MKFQRYWNKHKCEMFYKSSEFSSELGLFDPVAVDSCCGQKVFQLRYQCNYVFDVTASQN